jgi:thiamine-monophosphate kinase
MKLAEIGEFGFIDRLRLRQPAGRGVRLGIGDDCAVLELPPGQLLLTTTDLLIEEVHFRREWTNWRLLGRKSVTVNVSDIAAMGGIPRHLYLALGLPAGLAVEDLDQFVDGFREAAEQYGACLVGGDTCRSPGPLLISVTAEGSVPPAEVVSRAGARPGDGIYVSGTLGDSALALQRLQAGRIPEPELARRHFDPQARTALGRALAAAGLATAMIDLSDGLIADLGHVLHASGAGAQVKRSALPLSRAFLEGLAGDPALAELALSGGEDYELLFTAPAGREEEIPPLAAELALPLTRIGRVVAGQGLFLIGADGSMSRPGRGGFDHFSP